MYVKLINEKTIETAPRVLRNDEKTYSNPSPETLAEFGYLPFVETKMPEIDGYFFTKHYESDGNKVTVVWDKHEILQDEPENQQTEPMESENESAE